MVNFYIINKAEITEMIGSQPKRIKSILVDLGKELSKKNIINDIVCASDDQDTQWLFDVRVTRRGGYELTYTGTAK